MKVSLRGLRVQRNLPRATGRGLPAPAVVATGTPRIAASRRTAQRMRVYLKQHGKCAVCGVVIAQTEYELDHITPLHLGGGVEDRNTQVLCRACHADKTASEASARAKANRRPDV
jgi:5-methylcytosine-specific restriction endonuclease McrA